MPCLLEFGRDDLVCTHGGDTERNQRGRHGDMFKCARHGVLAANRRKPESHLHLERTEQGCQRLAVGVWVVRHALEILLIGEAYMAVVGTCSHDLGASLNYCVGSAMVRAPFGQERIVAECHN